MKASIRLTKKWLAQKHPSFDPLGLKHFMARQRTVESASKKIAPKGLWEGTSREGDAGGPSDSCMLYYFSSCFCRTSQTFLASECGHKTMFQKSYYFVLEYGSINNVRFKAI
ncbi:hypothetical protein Adt_23321 [Abeliophyllum distichum]|uniref:Uncharacterized protein n=1 Tax=Abeliophyllum distichum TaxID=126358 RepID=A0ABD1SAT7_9LAMI